MTKNKLFMILTMGSVAATMSCDGGSTASNSDLSTNDCPIGMFRPVGLDACVFAAVDVNGIALTLADDRCAAGSPAIPPACVSDAGLRSYLATSTTCAPNYRYEPGACERDDNNFGTAGAPIGGFGSAGAIGGGTGAAGIEQQAGASGGSAGAAGSSLGVAGSAD